MWGFFTFQCFVFLLIFAFSCLIFSSFPLLLDFLKPKSGPLNEVIGYVILNEVIGYVIYIYIYMPITPFGGPFLGFKMSRNRGRYEESGEKKTKKQKKTKCQDMKSTHLLGGCLFGAFLTVKLGIF